MAGTGAVMGLLVDLAAFGFTIWGIYKGFWVLRKIWRACSLWCAQKRFEREYISKLSAEYRLYGNEPYPEDSDWL